MQNTSQKPYLNLGCGLSHFPSPPPPGHEMVSPAVYSYPLWLNVDKVAGVGADRVFDLFRYPWPLEDDSFDGAVLGHIAEHIPHAIAIHEERVPPPGVVLRGGMMFDQKTGERVRVEQAQTRNDFLRGLQDGWFAFWAELWRVLSPGARVHVISPYGWSDGAITDPTHTRLLTVNTFRHALAPENNGGQSFRYETGCNFSVVGEAGYRVTPMFEHLLPKPEDGDEEQTRKARALHLALMTQINVAYDFYIQLEAVK